MPEDYGTYREGTARSGVSTMRAGIVRLRLVRDAASAGAGGADPIIAESPVEAEAVLTCAAIDSERAGIAQSLQRLGASNEAADLRTRDAALARIAGLKGCWADTR